jgi:inorganic pyrophosphatase
MADITKLPHRLDPEARTCRAVIETPKGRRSKFDYDPESGLFELAGLLPEGMSFPMDFGFIPSTLAEDGDPTDVLVLADEPSPVGCLAEVRLVGVIEGEQTEHGETLRNDRLLAVATTSRLYARIQTVDDLGDDFVDHLAQFWVNNNDLKPGRTFKVVGVRGPREAVALIQATSRKD